MDGDARRVELVGEGAALANADEFRLQPVGIAQMRQQCYQPPLNPTARQPCYHP
jgi:hypothetical protein